MSWKLLVCFLVGVVGLDQTAGIARSSARRLNSDKCNCLNGGRCVGYYYKRCSCPRGFRGRRCEFQKCPVDVDIDCPEGRPSRENRVTDHQANCLAKYEERWRTMDACAARIKDQIIKSRSCSCTHRNAISDSRSSESAYVKISRTGDCYMSPKILPTLNCSNQTMSCLKALKRLVKNTYSDELYTRACPRGLKQELKRCMEDYDTGRLRASGTCAPVQFYIDYFAARAKFRQPFICSGCNHGKVELECKFQHYDDMCGRLDNNQIAQTHQTQLRCMKEKFGADKACSGIQDKAVKAYDGLFQHWKAVDEGYCKSVTAFNKIRDEWGCTA